MKGAISKFWPTNVVGELETLKRKVDRLTNVESDINTDLENAEIQPGKKRRSEVELWLSHVKEKKSVFQQIDTEFRDRGSSRSLKRRIEDETRQVEELIQQGKFPKGVVLDDHESTRIPMVTTKLVGQSCTENADLILKLLKKDDVSAIGVYGMGGVGKTTLVKHIHNSLRTDADIAGKVYWVTVSRDCSLEKLQNQIGKAVGLQLSEDDKEMKAALLFQRLSGMKNFVIILDDLWKDYDPHQVGIPFDSGGCKIVVTTRSLDVCRRMGCQESIRIKPLPAEDSWKLFVKHSGVIPSDFNHLAEEIVEECGGLPLALMTMGSCARAYVTNYAWQNALLELKNLNIGQEDMNEKVIQVLKYSFDNLRDQKLQICFLCCALFSEDQIIDIEYLVDLWIDSGLLDEVQSPQDKVSRGHAFLNRLISSCLLESIDCEDGVKMHDLVRDMAIIITQNHPRFMTKSGEDLINVPEVEQWSEDLVKVSLSHNEIREIPNRMSPLTPQLRVLLLNYNYRLSGIPESFFKQMRALTVLDLSMTDIEKLPESVSDLENLRALLLVYCYELTYVPCLEKLSKLRVLDLDCAEKLEKAPEGIERLKCLEKVTYCPWDISDSTGFNMLIQSSPSLSCCRFFLHGPVFESQMLEDFWDDGNIVLVGGAEIGDDKTTYLLPATIEKLHIVESVVKGRNLGDVFPTLALATELWELNIDNCEGLEYILSSSSSSVGPEQGPFCKNMRLIDLPDLRGIIELGGCTAFSHLHTLVIEECPKIKVIFPHSEKQLSLPNLRYFKVSYCDELVEIFESKNGNHPNTILVLPNLARLQLSSLPKLQRLSMNLHLCASLEELSVLKCKELEEIFESGGNNSSPSSSTLHDPEPVLALNSLVTLNLKRLPKLSSIHKGLLLCPSLQHINIKDCLKLKMEPLSKHLICDDSPSSLLSLPSESDNPELWELLWRDYPEDARLLSDARRKHVLTDYINLPSY